VALIKLDFYAVSVQFACEDTEILDRVMEDFRYFHRPEAPDRPQDPCPLSIQAIRQAQDYGALPSIGATIYFPRNICYSQADITYIDYFGGALSVDRRRENSLVFSRLRAAQAMLRRAKVFVAELGRVPQQNLAAILSFLDSERLGRKG
jgi:hypothetical protein